MKKVKFDYSKLSGKIKEVFGTQRNFAPKMSLSERSLSLKMKNKSQWKQMEMILACILLNIPYKEIPAYFFCEKSSKK